MDREIKFRGKGLLISQWLYGSLITDIFTTHNNEKIAHIVENNKLNDEFDCWEDLLQQLDEFEIDPKTIGQYTGLKDRRGKEIYEGDIVKYTDGEIVRRTGAIEFDCWGFMLNEIGGMQVGLLGEIYDFEEFAFEVIGNIYENPELLENKKC